MRRKKSKWAVYYRSREYARRVGDPCLGYVWASSKEDADRMARVAGMGGVAGAWCVPVRVTVLTGSSESFKRG
jgi:hypothetical protein